MQRWPFLARNVEIAGRTWVVETVDDQDALLEASEGRAHFPFGMMLWESAIALSAVLGERPKIVADRTVLELGAGLGLCGVVAAALGGRVTQTDHDGDTLAACERTAFLNGVEGIARATGDWHDWRVPGTFDVILGADIAYDGADHGALLDVLARAMAPGGTVLLADPGREQQGAFVARAEAAGWTVSRTIQIIDDLKPAVLGAQMRVTILELRPRSGT
jgi:methyltransferase-like protein 23